MGRRPVKSRFTKKKPESKKARQRFKMLNMHFLSHFKYDLNEALARSDMDENQYDQFKANLITKSSRVGIHAGREYVDTMIKEELLDESSGERIKRLLQRYSKIR